MTELPHDYLVPACVHPRTTRLCGECQQLFDRDPLGYIEWGEHPAGIARWQALQEEIAEAARVKLKKKAS